MSGDVWRQSPDHLITRPEGTTVESQASPPPNALEVAPRACPAPDCEADWLVYGPSLLGSYKESVFVGETRENRPVFGEGLSRRQAWNLLRPGPTEQRSSERAFSQTSLKPIRRQAEQTPVPASLCSGAKSCTTPSLSLPYPTLLTLSPPSSRIVALATMAARVGELFRRQEREPRITRIARIRRKPVATSMPFVLPRFLLSHPCYPCNPWLRFFLAGVILPDSPLDAVRGPAFS